MARDKTENGQEGLTPSRPRAELMKQVENARPSAEDASAPREFDDFAVGDTVEVHISVKEGEKERVQVFTGLVIGRKGSGLSESFTVRRVVGDEGVERVFPFNSPAVKAVKVARRGKVRRAKLYYMRGRTGRQARIAERREYGGDSSLPPIADDTQEKTPAEDVEPT